MTERKGLFERAAKRLRKQVEPKTPKIVERGPAQHPDDDRMHISGDTEVSTHAPRDDG